MAPNDEYKSVYENEFEAEWEAWRDAKRAALAEWDARTAAEKKRRQPGRRKAYAELPDEFWNPLRAEIIGKYRIEELRAALAAAKDAREARLNELAPLVTAEPDPGAMYMVKSSHSYTYASQGYGAEKYARGALAADVDWLTYKGFTTYVRRLVAWTNPAAQYSCDREIAYFQLWTNCPDWAYDALSRRLTVADWQKSVERQGLNARVYNPFLPW